MEEKKNLEVVSGDGSNLNISQVYDHLNAARPKSAKEKPTGIVIPKVVNQVSDTETANKQENMDEEVENEEDEKKEEN